MRLSRHPLFQSLINLKGNARACVYSEPLWGIAYNLYIPYASLYMLAFGLTDQQIGLIASIGLVVQTLAAFLSGAVTDKLGRRLTTFLIEAISWAAPALIWALSQNFTSFVIAALLNSFFRISYTSWTCLMVEDSNPEILVELYTWISIFAVTTALVTPVTSWLIDALGLIPAMRLVYLFGFALFTIKLIVLYVLSSETQNGKIRQKETHNRSIFSLLSEYGAVLKSILQTPHTLYTIGLVTVMGITATITSTFWGIIAVEKIHLPESSIGYFAFARSLVMLVFYFGILPRIRHLPFKIPMQVGFILYILGQVILVLTPEKNVLLLVISVILDATSVALVVPQVDKLAVVTVSPEERARIMAIIYSITLIISSPFGWIAGNLSAVNRSLPFVLNIVLYILGFILTFFAARAAKSELQTN